jgi:hypothetical protein
LFLVPPSIHRGIPVPELHFLRVLGQPDRLLEGRRRLGLRIG